VRVDRRNFLIQLSRATGVALGGALGCDVRPAPEGAKADPGPPLADPGPALADDTVLAAPPPSLPDLRGAPDPFGDPWLSHRSMGSAGPAIRLDLPQLRYDGRWNPRPGAMRVLSRELRLRTRLEPAREPTAVEATDDALFETPFLYVAGEGELPSLGDAGEEQLRRFMDLGGLILFDAADGGVDRGFVRDVKALLQRIAPSSTVAPVGSDHVVFRSFYLVDTPMGRTRTSEHVLGIQEQGRLEAIIMRNDLGGALAETPDGLAAYPSTPGGAAQREWAIRFGVNILLYATCTDYKADRAHVETLLRSRRWR